MAGTADIARGAALKEWRIKAGLSLETVAGAADVSRQTLDNWERGHHSPRTEHVARMARLARGLFAALGMTDEPNDAVEKQGAG